MAKLGVLIGFGAGYVLGARAGRERYDQLMGRAQQVWRDPRVQKKASQAQDVVQEKATQAAVAVQDTVKDKVPGLGGDGADSGTSGTAGRRVAGSAPAPPMPGR